MSRPAASSLTAPRGARDKTTPAPRNRTRSAQTGSPTDTELSSLLETGRKVSRAVNGASSAKPEAVARKLKDKEASKTPTVRKAASTASLKRVQAGKASDPPALQGRTADKTVSVPTRRAGASDTPAARGVARPTPGSAPSVARATRQPTTKPAASSTAPSSIASDAVRIKAAMDNVNTGLRELSSAVMAGATYGAHAPTRSVNAAGSAHPTEDWTDTRLDALVRDTLSALDLLRSFSRSGALKNKAVELEKSALGLISKMVGVGMFEPGLRGLVSSRQAILELYPHDVMESIAKPAARTVPKTPSRSTLRTANPVPAVRVGTHAHADLLSFPAAVGQATGSPCDIGETALPDAVSQIMASSLILGWTAVLAAGNAEAASKTLLEMDRLASLPPAQALHLFSPELTTFVTPSAPALSSLYKTISTVSPQLKDQDLPVRLAMHRTEIRLLTQIQRADPQAVEVWRAVDKRLSTLIAAGEDVGGVVDFALWAIEWIDGREVQATDKTIAARRAVAALVRRACRKLKDPSRTARVEELLLASRNESLPVDLTEAMGKLDLKAGDVDALLGTFSMQIAAAVSALEIAASDADQTQQAVGMLTKLDFDLVSGALSSGNGTPSAPSLERIIRATEKLRRATTSGIQANTEYASSGIICLDKSLALLDACHPHISTTDSLGAQLDTNRVTCAIDAANTVFQRADGSSHQRALLYLVAGVTVARGAASDKDRADLLRCLSCVGYNLGARLWRENLHPSAIPLLEMAVDIGVEALARAREAYSDDHLLSEAWQSLDRQMSKRSEILAVSYQKSQRKKDAARAYAQGLLLFPASVQVALEDLSASRPLDSIASAHPAVDGAISRYAGFLASEALFVQSEGLEVAPPVDTPFAGLVAERLAKHLEPMEHRPEVGVLVGRLLDGLLRFYTQAQYPVRRQRVLAKVIELACMRSTANLAAVGEQHDLPSQHKHGDYRLIHLSRQYQASQTAWSAIYKHQSGVQMPRDELQASATRLETLLLAVIDGLRASSHSTPSTPKARLRSLDRSPPGNAIQTPPARRAVTSVEGKSPSTMSVKPVFSVLDDADRFRSHIEAFLAILEARGLSTAKISLLRCLRLLHSFSTSRGDLTSSCRLASEYARIGQHSKAAAIFSQASQDLDRLEPAEVAIELHIRHALFQAMLGQTAESRRLLGNVAHIASLDSFTRYSGTMKVRKQAEHKHWIASAHVVLSTNARNLDDPTAEIHHLTAALRIETEVLRLVFRLSAERPQAPSINVTVDVFQTESISPTNRTSLDETKNTQSRDTFVSNRQIGSEQLQALLTFGSLSLALSLALLRRGSAREAEAVLQQAQILADASSCSTLAANIAGGMAEVAISSNSLETAAEQLTIATLHWDTLNEMDRARLNQLRATLSAKQDKLAEAGNILRSGLDRIQESETEATLKEHAVLSPPRATRSGGPHSHSVALRSESRAFGSALGPTLRQHSWVLWQLGEANQSTDVCARARKLIATVPDDADYNYLAGQLRLADTFGAFKGNLFMHSLPDCSLTLPVGCLNTPEPLIKDTRRDVVESLAQAQRYFERHLQLVRNSGEVPAARQAGLQIAMMKSYQASLLPYQGNLNSNGAEVIGSLDYAAGLTIRREMLSAVTQRIGQRNVDDLDWTASAASVEPAAGVGASTKPEDYWDIVGSRYRAGSMRGSPVCGVEIERLPKSWPVIHINLAEDGGTLLVSRLQAGQEAVVFTLPLDRQGKREEEEEIFSFSDAIAELRDIIAASDVTSRDAKSVSTAEGRANWWSKRKALDKRLEELLGNIEFVWLGAFKTIFMRPNETAEAEILKLTRTLENIFRQALLSNHDRSKPAQIELDNTIVRCFSSLGATAKPQEYEDLVYYILDLHQFYGVTVALAELDIDQLCIDVQTALQAYEIAARRASSQLEDEHIFLVLDRKVQEIPWESLPVLRGRSISRVPALSFLLDRLDMTAMRNSAGPDAPPGKYVVDARKTHYILNPSKDLVRTQAHFEPWMRDMQEYGWAGRVAKAPLELDLKQALDDNELLLYFGHGGAEQFITSRKIRNLDNCAVTMLWGCSSGALKDNGDLDRTGTANNYMIGGCPSLIANLWDVTDKDIDRLSSAVMRDLHLDATHAKADDGAVSMSSVQALNRNRDECKLKYLTGAAPVVYGIPVYFAYGGRV